MWGIKNAPSSHLGLSRKHRAAAATQSGRTSMNFSKCIPKNGKSPASRWDLPCAAHAWWFSKQLQPGSPTLTSYRPSGLAHQPWHPTGPPAWQVEATHARSVTNWKSTRKERHGLLCYSCSKACWPSPAKPQLTDDGCNFQLVILAFATPWHFVEGGWTLSLEINLTCQTRQDGWKSIRLWMTKNLFRIGFVGPTFWLGSPWWTPCSLPNPQILGSVWKPRTHKVSIVLLAFLAVACALWTVLTLV